MRPGEEIFVRTFIAREKRQRWLNLLATPKSRRKITQRLYDGPPGDFNATLVHELEQMDAAALAEQLMSMGAGPTCWIVAADVNLDGTEEPLRDAVGATYG